MEPVHVIQMNIIPIEKISAGYVQRWAKSSRNIASEGPTVLHTSFCDWSKISKTQPVAKAQTLQH